MTCLNLFLNYANSKKTCAKCICPRKDLLISIYYEGNLANEVDLDCKTLLKRGIVYQNYSSKESLFLHYVYVNIIMFTDACNNKQIKREDNTIID